MYRYNFWQYAGSRTQVAATVARYATNELHTQFVVGYRYFIGFLTFCKNSDLIADPGAGGQTLC